VSFKVIRAEDNLSVTERHASKDSLLANNRLYLCCLLYGVIILLCMFTRMLLRRRMYLNSVCWFSLTLILTNCCINYLLTLDHGCTVALSLFFNITILMCILSSMLHI